MPEQVAVPRPVVEPNVPAAHCVQDDAPASEYVPALHVPEQVDTLRPDDEPKVPAWHNAHVDVFVMVDEIAPATA